jgi:hypothetical protein
MAINTQQAIIYKKAKGKIYKHILIKETKGKK